MSCPDCADGVVRLAFDSRCGRPSKLRSPPHEVMQDLLPSLGPRQGNTKITSYVTYCTPTNTGTSIRTRTTLLVVWLRELLVDGWRIRDSDCHHPFPRHHVHQLILVRQCRAELAELLCPRAWVRIRYSYPRHRRQDAVVYGRMILNMPLHQGS